MNPEMNQQQMKSHFRKRLLEVHSSRTNKEKRGNISDEFIQNKSSLKRQMDLDPCGVTDENKNAHSGIKPPFCDIPDGYGHQLCQAETPQEPQASDLSVADHQHKGDCKAVVSGLLCGKPAKWEVVFDIEPFLSGREREEKVHEELWNETFHHLAGRSILHDFEHMADKECEIEHGEL